jgi:hypothetical protein
MTAAVAATAPLNARVAVVPTVNKETNRANAKHFFHTFIQEFFEVVEWPPTGT